MNVIETYHCREHSQHKNMGKLVKLAQQVYFFSVSVIQFPYA